MSRPITTLYMLMSLDGKISTGKNDSLDFDKDLPKIDGVKQGLHQYYEIEQTTDLWSFNTGRVQAKVGCNSREMPSKSPVSFVLADNNFLTVHGVNYFCALSKLFVLITQNKDHPAFSVKQDNLRIILQDSLDLETALRTLYDRYGCDRLTVQSGGSMNALWLREGLIDYVDIVVAPVIVGGRETSTLVDGESFETFEQLKSVSVLKLESAETLEDSYVRLRYKVVK